MKKLKYLIGILLVIMIFLLIGKIIMTKEPQIHKMTHIKECKRENSVISYYVISHLPKNIDALKQLVDNYNVLTLDDDTIDFNFDYIRLFHKETRYTPRDYQESHSGYFSRDYIENHMKDWIVEVKWTMNKEGEKIRYYRFYDGTSDAFIIDSFYEIIK